MLNRLIRLILRKAADPDYEALLKKKFIVQYDVEHTLPWANIGSGCEWN